MEGSKEMVVDYAQQANLLLTEDAENVGLTGMGEIHGQSPHWVIPWMNESPTGWDSLNVRRPGKMFLFRNCRHVRVEGVRMFDSPNWTLVFQDCAHVAVRGVFMRHFDAINADGIDVVDSQHVTIADCDLHVTDDGICLKTDGSNPTPAGVRNVVVSNCVIRTWCNGVKIGTESNGTFEDIAFSNIVVHNPDDDLKGAEGGINVCCCDGGLVRNVSIRKTAEFRPGPFPQPVPACAQQYPTPFMFGSPDGGRRDCGDGLPAHGLYLRDVACVRVRDFEVACAEPDGRPCVAKDSCSELS
jgi:polygalacturonase